MKITLDIPDSLYRELKTHVAMAETTLGEFILGAVIARVRDGKAHSGRRASLPVVRSKNPASLKLEDEGVYEYIPFP